VITSGYQARKVVDQERDQVFSLLRATWFFQRSNGALEPYDEALALRYVMVRGNLSASVPRQDQL
jgi:hypothetical protein